MNGLKATFLMVLLTLVAAGGQAAPVSGYDSSPENSTDEAGTTNIAVLQTEAKANITAVFQEISLLEIHTEQIYNLSHQDCYVRFEPTNDVDVNTLKDDVKSLNKLLPVIKDIADNETDEIILDNYEKIISSTNCSIIALNNFIAALEKNATADNVTKEEEKGEGFNTDSQGNSNTTETTPTDGKSTDSPVNDKTDTGSKDISETDRCMQLDKVVKLSALKLQAELTWIDIQSINIM